MSDPRWVVAFLVAVILASWFERSRTERRLRALEAKYQRLARHAGLDSADASEPSAEVQLLARTPGQKIAAIKLYREQSGVGLRQAKEVVDRIEAAGGDP
jgi:ribosomal protein L7/L12